MTATTEDNILEAIAELMRQVSPSDVWQTDIGSSVAVADGPVEIEDTTQAETRVYTTTDTINGGKGSEHQDRECRITLAILVDSLARPPEGGTASQQKSRMKADHRKALMPTSAQLLLATVRVSNIRYMGSELIDGVSSAGLIGVRSRVECFYKEPITPV